MLIDYDVLRFSLLFLKCGPFCLNEVNALYCYYVILQIMREDNFTGNFQEYLAHLRQDPENFYATSVSSKRAVND